MMKQKLIRIQQRPTNVVQPNRLFAFRGDMSDAHALWAEDVTAAFIAGADDEFFDFGLGSAAVER